MEFLNLGDQCSQEDCRQLDFLPVTCQHCCRQFCQDHCQPYQHCCPEQPPAPKGSDSSDFKLLCDVRDCDNRELMAVSCPHCRGNFCLPHRHPSDHTCPSLAPRLSSVEQRAQQKVAEIAAGLANKRGKKAGHKDPKLAAKVQLMRLKQRATMCCSAGVPQDHRCYLLVLLPQGQAGCASRSVAVCVDAAWTVGRALDAVAEHAKVSNHNNEGRTTSLLQLFRHHDGSVLPAGSVLAALLVAGSLCNGESVVLEETQRGQTILTHLEDYVFP